MEIRINTPRSLFVYVLLTAVRLGASEHSEPAETIKPDEKFPLGRRPSSLVSREYASLLWEDTRGILSSPLHWDRNAWSLAGGLTAATAAAAIFDGNIRREAQTDRNHDGDVFFNQWQRFGAEYSFAVLGGFEAWGVIGNNPRARAVAMDGLTASIIADGIITPALKYSIGRVRPNQTAATFSFKPFSGHDSFPSGHVTQAFAVATVIASHYDDWWQQSLAYGTASLVVWGRIQQNRHFTSDVVAGAAVGWAVGRAVVRRHNIPHPVRVGDGRWTPWFDHGGGGLVYHRNF